MFSKLKQFKDLKDKAKTLQTMLAAEVVEGTAGWGKVKISINGNQEVQSVSIDQGAMDDRAKLETLMKEAMNDAFKKLQSKLSAKMREGGGLDLAAELQGLTKK